MNTEFKIQIDKNFLFVPLQDETYAQIYLTLVFSE